MNPDSPIKQDPPEPLVSVSGLSKKYRLFHGSQERLRHALQRTLPRSGGDRAGEEFWALRDISFSLGRGEVLGVLGKNGAGKSTLLQVLAGISAPSEGSVSVSGTAGALLELGAGFYPEFTGRENVFLAGAVLGFSRKQIQARLEEIRDFAEIGEFFDQPVRTYSNGMFLRLAFAVQAGLRPDVFLVDEVLSVGDIFFQQKCHLRMEELLRDGMSLVLVSHDVCAIQKYSTRALLLDRGRPVFLGSPAEAVGLYHKLDQPARSAAPPPAGPGPRAEEPPLPEPAKDRGASMVSDEGKARLIDFSITGERGQGPEAGFCTGETLRFDYAFEVLKELETPVAGIQILNRLNINIHGKSSLHTGAPVPEKVAAGSVIRVRQEIRMDLESGEYILGLLLGEMPRDVFHAAAKLDTEVLESRVLYVIIARAGAPLVLLPAPRGLKRPFYGMADLPGACAVEIQEPGE